MTNKTGISLSEGMFYGFYTILTVVKGMGLYEGMRLYEIGLAAAFVCLFVKLLSERYEMRGLLLCAGALVLGIITWRISGKMGALFNLALLVGMKGIDREKLFRWSAVLWGVIFSLQCFLQLSGLRTQQIFRIHRKLGTYIVRWSMGFTHPNVLHITYFILAALLLYARKPKGRQLLHWSLALMAGNVFVFAYSISYTGAILVTVYLLMNLALQQLERKSIGKGTERAVCAVCCLLPIACILFAVAGPLVLKGRAFELVNKALSTRFELSRQYLLGQGVHLFGSANMEQVDATITVDSSYVYMLVHYGLIYFLLFAVLLEAAVVRYWRERNFSAVAILLACAVSGVTEQYMANTSFKNITMLLIAPVVYELLENRRSTDGKCAYVLRMPLADRQLPAPHWSMDWQMRTAAVRLRFQKREKKIAGAAAVLFVLGVLGYVLCVSMPSAIYAAPWDCDRKEGAAGEAYVYDYDLLADPAFDGWILSDKDALGKLYDFDGVTVQLEYGRRAVGAGTALVILLLWGEAGIALLKTPGRRDAGEF